MTHSRPCALFFAIENMVAYGSLIVVSLPSSSLISGETLLLNPSNALILISLTTSVTTGWEQTLLGKKNYIKSIKIYSTMQIQIVTCI